MDQHDSAQRRKEQTASGAGVEGALAVLVRVPVRVPVAAHVSLTWVSARLMVVDCSIRALD
jgi:hypothetical protein